MYFKFLLNPDKLKHGFFGKYNLKDSYFFSSCNESTTGKAKKTVLSRDGE